MLIESFEAACAEKKLDPTAVLPDLSCYPEEHRNALISMAKSFVVVDVLNDGWRPIWGNDESKWELYWDLSGAGFRLCLVDCDYSYSYVGSRLIFKSKSIAKHAAKYFEDLFKAWMIFE